MQNSELPHFLIDDKKLSHYTLSILLSNNKVAFSIFDAADNQYIFFKQKFLPETESLTQKLTWLADSDSLLQKKYRNINIVLKTGANALVPAELFTMETAMSIAKLNFGEQTGKTLKANYLKSSINAVNLFQEDEELSSVIAERFLNVKICHITTPLICSALSKSKDKTESELYIELAHQSAWTVLLKEQKLLSCNKFEFTSEEELKNSLFNLCKELQLDRKKTPLILSGSIDNDSDNAHLLNEFFDKIHYADLPNAFSYTPHLKVLLTNEYSTFLSLPLCEL